MSQIHFDLWGDAARIPRPKVLRWFKAFCSLMVLWHVTVAAFGAALATGRITLPEGKVQHNGELYLTAAAILAGLFLIGVFIPRRKWSWFFGLFLLVLTMTNPCCLPAAVVILIFWFKPNCRAYFA